MLKIKSVSLHQINQKEEIIMGIESAVAKSQATQEEIDRIAGEAKITNNENGIRY
ncbi:MAG: hypothetical protein LBD91_00240 [Prevotellaceae bacterium]|jgi:hypothetical protein|nr:hypothetical protein [Prevotellaceae bacterium]